MKTNTKDGLWGTLLPLGRLPLWRKGVQAIFGLFCLYAGYRFYLFFLWGTGRSEDFVQRPPSVEAFLPISALIGLKKLVLTGHYDIVHPAGLTIFLAALAISLLLRKGFCGWICPVGFISHRVAGIGNRLGLSLRMPIWLEYPLLSLKYILLAFFSYLILWKMSLQSIEGFLRSPYNVIVDAKMLLFFLAPSNTTLWVMIILVLVSFPLRNFWCRFLCPYGALLGIIALAGPTRVQRDDSECIDCKRCDKVCPGSILVSTKTRVRTAECIGCLDCVAVCPKENCLTVGLPLRKTLPAYAFPLLVVGLFILFWAVALSTGHWHSEVAPETFRKLYKMVLTLPHP